MKNLTTEEIQVLWDGLDVLEDTVDHEEDKDYLHHIKKLKSRLHNLTVRFDTEKECEECGEIAVIYDTVYGACQECIEDSNFHGEC